MSAEERMRTLMAVAGGFLTALAILLPPTIYFGLSYQHAAGLLEAEAEISSLAINQIVATDHARWTFQQVRLAELLNRSSHHPDPERRRILDLQGRVVMDHGDPLPGPVLVRALPLLDGGRPVGRIEVSRSLRPILLAALLFALGLLPIGVAAFVILRAVPLRAIRAGERALRRQRDAAQSYLDVAGVAFVRLDEELRVRLVNRQAEAALGRGAAEVLGREWVASFVEPGARQRVAAELAQARPGTILTLEHGLVRPDGAARILAWFVTAAADEAGRPGLLASGVDLTRQRELEQQLLHAQKLEAVGRLAGGVAHEFNNILSVIKVYASALRRGLAEGNPARPDVDEIISAADRAVAVARSLLAFSRRQALEAAAVDLASVVRSAERLLRPLLRADLGLQVTVVDEPLPVLADPVQVEQVLLNLVTNARDAIGGAGRIAVSASAEPLDAERARILGLAPGRHARLEVADDGPGFDEATRARVFEPFFTTKPVGQGTGLGLSIAYGIVTQHRGAITCRSEPGHGASFVIWLPLLDSPVPRPGPAPTSQAAPAGGSEAVLVADDDPALRRVLRRLLERAGYSVVEAEDGLAAAARFEAERDRIRLALLDVIMPGQNGRQALDRIRALAPGLPAIFLSGHTAELSAQRDVPLGGERLLRKPVEPEELLRAVREALDA